MSDKRSPSIRKQLLLWLIIPIFILLGLSIGSNYLLSQSFVNTAFDDGLEELAKMLAGQVEQEPDGHFELANPALTKKIMKPQSAEHLYFLILGPQQEFIAGEKTLGLPPGNQSTPQYRHAIVLGRCVRVVTIYMPLDSEKQYQRISVQLAETLEDRGSLIGKILFTTIAHQLMLILLAVACVWFGVTRGLQPLERISQAIKSRSPSDLSVLHFGKTPAEVQPLIVAINDLMIKIKDYLAMQRRFVANSAHQLRTPIAGFQTQVELLMRQDLPESAQHTLAQIQAGLGRSTQLLHQLLSLSRAEPDALKLAQYKPVNLSALLARVAESFVPFALKKNIDFGIDASEASIDILGDEGSLHDLISNLIDNALLYTPNGGRVTVHLRQKEKVLLSVEDDGPGIPCFERQKVFERFYRVPGQEGNGSGLGLAIVQETAQAHGAEVSIDRGSQQTGTQITVAFPLFYSDPMFTPPSS
jgi:two-component system sensor histidine kinase TctE